MGLRIQGTLSKMENNRAVLRGSFWSMGIDASDKARGNL